MMASLFCARFPILLCFIRLSFSFFQQESWTPPSAAWPLWQHMFRPLRCVCRASERAKRREKLNGEEKRRRHRRRRRLASEVLMQSALIRLWFQHTIPAFSCPIHRPRHQKYMHSSRPRKRERETKASPLFLELIDNNQTKKNGKTDRRRPRCHRSDLFFSVRRWRLQGRAPGRRRRYRPAPRPAAEAVSAWCVVGEEQRKREKDSALTSSSSSHLKTLTRYPNLLLLHLARPPSPTSHSTTSSAPRASARTSAT